MERLYTVEEVAEITRINEQTIRRLCRDGELVAIKFGAHWRIPESSLLPKETKGKVAL